MSKLYVLAIKTPAVDRAMNRAWTEVKTNR
jgi:hypothetical protein